MTKQNTALVFLLGYWAPDLRLVVHPVDGSWVKDEVTGFSAYAAMDSPFRRPWIARLGNALTALTIRACPPLCSLPLCPEY